MARLVLFRPFQRTLFVAVEKIALNAMSQFIFYSYRHVRRLSFPSGSVLEFAKTFKKYHKAKFIIGKAKIKEHELQIV